MASQCSKHQRALVCYSSRLDMFSIYGKPRRLCTGVNRPEHLLHRSHRPTLKLHPTWPQIKPREVPTVVPRCSKKVPKWCRTVRIDLRQFAPKAREHGSPEVATRLGLARRRPLISNGLEKRRARDSNPQPVARHHISSCSAHLSTTVQNAPSRTRLRSWGEGQNPPPSTAVCDHPLVWLQIGYKRRGQNQLTSH